MFWFVVGDFRKQQIKKTNKHCYIKIIVSFIQEEKTRLQRQRIDNEKCFYVNIDN